MSKRLQVSLDDAEFRLIQRLAHRDKVTIAEWVRRCLREAATSGHSDAASRLAVIDAAYRHTSATPEPEIDQILDEIERGYGC